MPGRYHSTVLWNHAFTATARSAETAGGWKQHPHDHAVDHHLGSVAPANILAITQVVNLVRGLTGWDTSLWELVKVAERGKALARVLNCREGFTANDDTLPNRLHEAFSDGPLKGIRIDSEKFTRALRLYHRMEGRDPETGRPTFAKLAELGIEWAAKP